MREEEKRPCRQARQRFLMLSVYSLLMFISHYRRKKLQEKSHRTGDF